ncbi:MAG: copper uptake system-associated protein, partial [Aestuariivirga sp.]
CNEAPFHHKTKSKWRMNMKTINRRTWLALSAATVLFSKPVSAHDDKEHIIGLMKSIFDTPENPLAVTPVVVRGDNAIASWAQGGKGGRALLWRKDDKWDIRLCSGAPLKDAKMLEGAGISAEDAKSMTAELIAEEAKLDPQVAAQFDLFEGTVDMSGQTGHGAHKHGAETQSQ